MKVFFSLCICFFTSCAVNAQDHQFERISTKNGLPSSNVNDIQLDHEGYLWVSTLNGLFRYDGYNFVTAIPNKEVVHLAINKKGMLYGKDGESFFQLNAHTFQYDTLIQLINTDDNPNNDQYNNLFIDSKNNVWSCDFNHIKRYNVVTKQLDVMIKLVEKKGNPFFAQFIEDDQQQIWIASTQGLYKFDESAKKVSHVLDVDHFSCVFRAHEILYLGTVDGKILHYDMHVAKTTKVELPNVSGQINFLLKENEDKFLFGTKGHLFQYDPLTKQAKEIDAFAEKNINFRKAIYDTVNQFIWIGTDVGILKYNIGRKKDIQKIDLPKSMVVYPVTIHQYVEQTRNIFYLALSNAGILQWNAIHNTFQHIPIAGESDDISCISITPSGEIYAAGYQHVYKVKNHSLQKILDVNGQIEQILIDRKNRLWVLPHHKEMQVYDANSLQRLSLWHTAHDAAYFSLNSFFDIAENRDGKIWLAAWFPKGYGICTYDETKKTIIDISDYNDRSLFIGDYYYSIGRQKNTTNLIFTGYGGSNMVDSNGKLFNQIYCGKKDNENAIPIHKKCYIDEKGNHWLSSTEGLYYVSKDKTKVARISELDGLTDNDVSNGFLLTQDNKLLMAHNNQIEILDINSFGENERLPKLSLSAVKILGNNKQVNIDSLQFERTENNLSFDFTTLTFNNPAQNHYQYRMTGSQQWIDNGNSNNITFSNLSYGKHSFEVKVGDNLGNWSAQPAVFSFYIQPYVYETNWFKALIILASLSIVWFFIYTRINKIKKEAVQKLQIFKLSSARNMAEAELANTRELLKSSQLDALRSQMNPHFIFNSLNSIESYVLKNERLLASEYLGKFSKLIRNILENSKSEQIALEKEIETLQLYIKLEQIRTNENFDVSYNIAQTLFEDNIMLPPMLMQPHVENAILHGIRFLDNRRGHLTISLSITHDECLVYTLQDNGIGRRKALQNKNANNFAHKSYGLDITQNRIDLYNQKNNKQISYTTEDLYNEKDEALGTKVTVLIPLI